MTHDEARTIEQLLQKQLSGFQETIGTQITKLSKRVEEGFAASTSQIDTVARHLQEFDEKATTEFSSLKATQSEHSQALDRIERRHNADLNRLDDHGTRIETLEAKTAHLPASR